MRVAGTVTGSVYCWDILEATVGQPEKQECQRDRLKAKEVDEPLEMYSSAWFLSIPSLGWGTLPSSSNCYSQKQRSEV